MTEKELIKLMTEWKLMVSELRIRQTKFDSKIWQLYLNISGKAL